MLHVRGQGPYQKHITCNESMSAEPLLLQPERSSMCSDVSTLIIVIHFFDYLFLFAVTNVRKRNKSQMERNRMQRCKRMKNSGSYHAHSVLQCIQSGVAAAARRACTASIRYYGCGACSATRHYAM